MHADLLKGKWEQLKRRVKEKWDLTDHDLEQIKGNEETLLETLEKKFGYSRDKAEDAYHAFIVRYERRHVKRNENSADQ
jgi:uncharacterized protein YjbJ (UPF0337 family)